MMSTMKKAVGLVIFLAFVGLLVAMFFTCPTEKDHRRHLHKIAMSALEHKVDERYGPEVGGLLMGVARMSFLGNDDKIHIERLVRVENYYLFSVGHLDLMGNDHIVSVGVMNHIFAPDKDDILEMMSQYGL